MFAYKLKIYVTVYITTQQTKHTMIKILKCGIKLKLYKSNYDSFKNAFFFRIAPYIKFRLKKKQKKDLKKINNICFYVNKHRLKIDNLRLRS